MAGSRMATPAAGPSAGSAPTARPSRTPTSTASRFCGRKAPESPLRRRSMVSMMRTRSPLLSSEAERSHGQEHPQEIREDEVAGDREGDGDDREFHEPAEIGSPLDDEADADHQQGQGQEGA